MASSRERLVTSLAALETERKQVVRRLLRVRDVAIGSVSELDRKCGNKYCHCVDGAKHRQMLFLFKDHTSGQRRCKLVRRVDEKRMGAAGARYRAFRKDLRSLRTIDFQEKEMFMALAERSAITYE